MNGHWYVRPPRIGAWTYGTQYVGVFTGSGYRHLAVRGPMLSDEEWENNARLMAAAPELLKALRDVLKEAMGLYDERMVNGGEYTDWACMARHAITKATGKRP